MCSSELLNMFTSIKEAATCTYVAVISTPLLCKHANYKPKVINSRKVLITFKRITAGEISVKCMRIVVLFRSFFFVLLLLSFNT